MKTLLTSCGLALVLAVSPQVFAAGDMANNSGMVKGTVTLQDGSKVNVYASPDDVKKLQKEPKGTEAITWASSMQEGGLQESAAGTD